MAAKLRRAGWEREISRLTTLQHGVVGREQLLAIGIGERTLERWIGSGRLHTIHRETFSVSNRRLSLQGRWMAAVLACGPGAVLSHEDAAWLWGLCGTRSPTDVTAPRGRQGRLQRQGIRLHRSRTLEDPERAVRNGIPVTTVARTLFDLAESADPASLARHWEEADKLRLLRIDAVAAAYERGRHRHRARARIRPLLAEARHSERTRSPLEDRFAAFCRHFELPPPASNVLVLEKEVDAAWLDAHLLVELDSWEHHAHRAAFERDRKRDIALMLAGYRTIRVTHRRLDGEAATLAAEIRELLAT